MKFKHLFLIGALAVSAAGITGCGKSASQEAEVVEGNEVVALSVDTISANPAAFYGDTITVEGVCSHLCKHGGKKAFILGSDSTIMLMCVADSNLVSFAPDCPGKTLTVVGVLNPMTATRADLVAMAEAEVAKAEAGHCDTEQKANGTAAFWLDSLDKQIAAGGDSTLVVGKYLTATSYMVAE